MSDNESETNSDKHQPEFPKTKLDSSDSDLSDDEMNDNTENIENKNDGKQNLNGEENKKLNKPNLFGDSSEDEEEETQEQEQQIVDHNELDENEVMKEDSPSESDSDDEDEKKDVTKEVEKADSDDPENSSEFANADPDNSFLPSSPAYEQDHHLQEHESRLVGGSSGKRRVAIDSDDSDDGEHQVKRPHQELDDDDIGDPFAEPLKDPLENQNQEDPDTSDTDKPQPGKGADDEDDPSISDFDKAMGRRKKAMKRARKSRGDSTFLGEADDLINDLMRQMSEASTQDKEASQNGVPAINKLKLLPKIDATFKVKDYHESFIDNGVMTAIADWLTPLPNNFLPNLQIRTSLLNSLTDFPDCSIETLKASGVGKAVNRLLQHPKELLDNKRKCKKLVRRYSKLIFGIVDVGAVSKEERLQRDLETLRRYGASKKTKYQKLKDQQSEEAAKKKSWEKGFMPRARVPMPSNRDYLVRPKDNIDGDSYPTIKTGGKKIQTGNEALMDKTKKRLVKLASRKSSGKAGKVSLSGGKGYFG